jgi:VanZ family protein
VSLPDVETPTRERVQARWRWGFVVAVAVHLAVLYWPRSPSTGGLPIDKPVHAAIFGMVLWAAAQARLRVGLVGALLAGHAVLSELIQHYLLTGRSGDVTDSVADLAGVVIVTLILWRRR